jgi:hypothetical protein
LQGSGVSETNQHLYETRDPTSYASLYLNETRGSTRHCHHDPLCRPGRHVFKQVPSWLNLLIASCVCITYGALDRPALCQRSIALELSSFNALIFRRVVFGSGTCIAPTSSNPFRDIVPGRQTPVRRMISSAAERMQLDREVSNPLPTPKEHDLVAAVTSQLSPCSLVILLGIIAPGPQRFLLCHSASNQRGSRCTYICITPHVVVL